MRVLPLSDATKEVSVVVEVPKLVCSPPLGLDERMEDLMVPGLDEIIGDSVGTPTTDLIHSKSILPSPFKHSFSGFGGGLGDGGSRNRNYFLNARRLSDNNVLT